MRAPALLSLLALLHASAFAQEPVLPNEHLLFNGWGITPAGKHEPVSDMPLKMIVGPDGKVAVAVCAGYTNPGLAVISMAEQKIADFISLPHTWNGIAFDLSGTKLLVSGGASKELHVFDYKDGRVSGLKSVPVANHDAPLFIAGIAVHPVTGKIYLCNEADNEVLVLNQETYAVEQTIAAGEHPPSCLFGTDRRHLYV